MARKERYGFNNSYYLPHLTAFNAPHEIESGGWFSVDMELAFRLGLLVLALPRPQLLLRSREVRFMDHESQLMARLFRLPVESACPWVVDSLRREAQILAHGVERVAKFDGNLEKLVFFFQVISCFTLGWVFRAEEHALKAVRESRYMSLDSN